MILSGLPLRAKVLVKLVDPRTEQRFLQFRRRPPQSLLLPHVQLSPAVLVRRSVWHSGYMDTEAANELMDEIRILRKEIQIAPLYEDNTNCQDQDGGGDDDLAQQYSSLTSLLVDQLKAYLLEKETNYAKLTGEASTTFLDDDDDDDGESEIETHLIAKMNVLKRILIQLKKEGRENKRLTVAAAVDEIQKELDDTKREYQKLTKNDGK